MKTPHPLYKDRLTGYTCALTACALCGASLVERGYQSSPKTLFPMPGMLRVAQRPKRCPNVTCAWHATLLKSAAWRRALASTATL